MVLLYRQQLPLQQEENVILSQDAFSWYNYINTRAYASLGRAGNTVIKMILI